MTETREETQRTWIEQIHVNERKRKTTIHNDNDDDDECTVEMKCCAKRIAQRPERESAAQKRRKDRTKFAKKMAIHLLRWMGSDTYLHLAWIFRWILLDREIAKAYGWVYEFMTIKLTRARAHENMHVVFRFFFSLYFLRFFGVSSRAKSNNRCRSFECKWVNMSFMCANINDIKSIRSKMCMPRKAYIYLYFICRFSLPPSLSFSRFSLHLFMFRFPLRYPSRWTVVCHMHVKRQGPIVWQSPFGRFENW